MNLLTGEHSACHTLSYSIVESATCPIPIQYATYSSTGAVVDTRQWRWQTVLRIARISSPWGSISAEKPSKAWQALCASYLCLPSPSLHFAQPQKPLPSLVSCPLYSLFGSEKGPYIFLDLLPWHQRAWESSRRSRTGQHLPRCTTGESTFRPLLHLLDHA